MPYKDADRYRKYMKFYMRDYRKLERTCIRQARKNLNLTTQLKTNPKARIMLLGEKFVRRLVEKAFFWRH